MRAPSRIAGGAAALLALAAAGCNLAPKYSAPRIATPSAFKEAAAPAEPGVAWVPALPEARPGRGRWWEIYRDPQLGALEERVRVSNQTVAAAAARFRAARAAALAARSALFPLVAAAPSAQRVRSSRNWTSSSNAGKIVDQYSLPVDASYEIDLWGRIGNTAKAGALEAQAGAADLAAALLSTQAELAQDYFALRALDARRAILDETTTSYREALKAVQALARSGIDSDEDVARARNQLDTAIAQDTDLEASRALYEHAIAALIGSPPAAFSLAAGPLPARPPEVPAGLPSDLLERRPDIAAAERRVAAANAEIGVARTAYFPSLTLDASGGWEATHAAEWFAWPSRFWSLGPALGATLFDWGARKALTEEARAAFDQAAADYRQTVLGAFESVEDNLAALRILGREAAEEQTAVDSSRRVLRLAQTRYRLGIDSYLNVVTAQTELLSAREADVQIELRRMTASVSLVRALGGGWDLSQLPGARAVVSSPSRKSSATAAGRPPALP